MMKSSVANVSRLFGLIQILFFVRLLSEIQYASMQLIFRTKTSLALAVVATEVLENRWHSFDQAPSIFR